MLRVGAATTIKAAGQPVTLMNTTNDFIGAVSVEGSTVQLRDANALMVVLAATGDVSLASAGALQVSGTVSGAASDIALSASGATVFGALDVAGSLELVSGGAVSQLSPAAGSTAPAPGLVVRGSTTTMTATGQSITLGNSTNDFGGLVTLVGAAVTLRDASALKVDVVASGSTSVTAGGLLEANRVSVDGKAVTLSLATSGALVLGAVNAAGAVSLSAGGAVTQTDDLIAGGALSVNAPGQAVTLSRAGNRYSGSVSVTGGAVTVQTPGTLQITVNASENSSVSAGGALTVSGSTSNNARLAVASTTATTLGALTVDGLLTVSSAGPITQTTGGVLVRGATSLLATGQAITLDNSNANDFTGLVTVSGSAVRLGGKGALVVALDASDTSSLVARGTLAVSGAVKGPDKGLTLSSVGATSLGRSGNEDGLAVSGALALTSTGAVTQVGVLQVGSTTTITATGQAVTLANQQNDFGGAVTVAGAGVVLSDVNALQATLTASADSTLLAAGALQVAGALSGSSRLSLTSGATTVFGALNVGGALSLVSPGAVTQVAAAQLKVGGATTIGAAGQTVTLANSNNDFGGQVSVTAASASLRDTNALNVTVAASGSSSVVAGAALSIAGKIEQGDLTLGSASLAIAGALGVAGALSITSTGAISQSADLSVGGALAISASGQSVSLAREGNRFGGAVTVAGAAVSLRDSDALQLSLTASGASTVTSGGALTVAGSATGTAALTLSSAGETSLGSLNVAGAFTLTSAAGVTQTGTGVRVGGAAVISAAGQAVVLDSATNDFAGATSVTAGTVRVRDASALTLTLNATDSATVVAGGALSVSGEVRGEAKSLSLTAGAATTLGMLTVSGSLELRSAGAVAQALPTTGANPVVPALVIGGATTVIATGQAVTLGSAGNEFSGVVSVTGGAVTLRDKGALELTLTAGGASTVTATGALQVSGSVGTGASLALTSGGETALGALTVGGALSLISAGAVRQIEPTQGSAAPALKVGAATTVSASGQTITLSGEANDFGGVVTANGTTVSLRDMNTLAAVISATDTTSVVAGAALTVSGSVTGAGGLTL
ncbi:MAG: hypothetical protein EB027_03840, partial [Actinobacteria bacterium]|nr:hypothetical protein [Actinomycetota bacterium]